MKRESLKKHLRPYSIAGSRKTTINHAFASAVALNHDYDEKLVIEALRALGQDPDADLMCAYCDKNPAETWDHVVGLVKAQHYSGFGHTIGNLLPCCKQCNSRKGNKDWREFVAVMLKDEVQRAKKVALLDRYFSRYLEGYHLGYDEVKRLCPDEIRQLDEAQNKIIELMKHSDEIAVILRKKVKEYLNVQIRAKI